MLKDVGKDSLVGLLLLLPGFLTRQTMAYLGNTAGAGDFEIIATSLAFSLLNLPLVLLVWKVATRSPSTPDSDAGLVSIRLVAGAGCILLVAVLMGVAAERIDRTGAFYRAVGSKKVSQERPWIYM